MELEFETLEEDAEKLDLVLAEAPGWRFPLAKGKNLVFNPRKTKWEGWHGPNLGKSCLSIVAFACTALRTVKRTRQMRRVTKCNIY